MKAILLACSSLAEYLNVAQKKCGTKYPVRYLDRSYHRDPRLMREQILTALAEIPEDYDTILVAMGYCGGSWENVSTERRIVLPKVDDCVTLLMTVTEEYQVDRKKPGCLYIKERNPEKTSFRRIFDRYTENLDAEEKARIHAAWKETYSGMCIIDTGLWDTYDKTYTESVYADGAWLEADVGHVPGGTLLLEKLVSGAWDEQFAVIEPGKTAGRKDFFGLGCPTQ